MGRKRVENSQNWVYFVWRNGSENEPKTAKNGSISENETVRNEVRRGKIGVYFGVNPPPYYC